MRIQCLFRLQIESQGHSLGIGSLVCDGVRGSGVWEEEVDVRLLDSEARQGCRGRSLVVM